MTLEGYKLNAEIDNGAEVGTIGKKLTVTWTTTKSVKKNNTKPDMKLACTISEQCISTHFLTVLVNNHKLCIKVKTKTDVM